MIHAKDIFEKFPSKELQLETEIDEVLKNADFGDRSAAVFHFKGSKYNETVIENVKAKYEANGWIVKRVNHADDRPCGSYHNYLSFSLKESY